MLGQQEQPRVLSQAEVEALEKTVAKSRDDRAGQKLLGQNYAFFILGITSLDQFGQALRTGGMTPRRYRIRIENEPHTLGEPEKSFAESLIERAVSLEPDNQTWRHYWQSVLRSRGMSGGIRLDNRPGPVLFGPYTKSFDAMKANVATMTEDPRLFALSDLVKQAVRESRYDDAKAVAHEMLAAVAKAPDNQLSGHAEFDANLALGAVALAQGDKKAACGFLIAAGQCPASTLISNVPRMSTCVGAFGLL